jgi:hypothetical protein
MVERSEVADAHVYGDTEADFSLIDAIEDRPAARAYATRPWASQKGVVTTPKDYALLGEFDERWDSMFPCYHPVGYRRAHRQR